MNVIQGEHSAPPQGRFALIAARFNDFIVQHLIDGARDTLLGHGVAPADIDLIRVPGAFEIAQAADRAARSGRYVAVVALGCVIRGATPHFDYVADAAASGLARTAHASGIPVLFGVLTTDDVDQAMERAGGKAGNKGADAALAAIEMVDLWKRL
ncbi:MAG TPA: 6,7-dimethyl-8-ribityllumazine synthase [Rhodanobacteraceae bacterium]|nr:6,7-dimethyl-8-ribityllumazine synthase [Rhodanobacteraceae bacterium]